MATWRLESYAEYHRDGRENKQIARISTNADML
jgi:hypothetical protein